MASPAGRDSRAGRAARLCRVVLGSRAAPALRNPVVRAALSGRLPLPAPVVPSARSVDLLPASADRNPAAPAWLAAHLDPVRVRWDPASQWARWDLVCRWGRAV